jgi:hypothetical protein
LASSMGLYKYLSHISYSQNHQEAKNTDHLE